ncbi:MAG TPA: pentapeptide repeat-containing protein, partial [Actinomycetota bacterium]|nr:pentapeptide repeat-containing protein [Actinomycetota bacterium]
RSAKLSRVAFEDCRMAEIDLLGAELSSVAFAECDLSRATLSDVRFERTLMRGCDLDGVVDAARLRGVAMPWPDVIRSAAVLADAVGIRIVVDD